jgi:5-amino-6-(5-phospho-D-ribitylamino)uracil phosphatase
MKTLYISDLDGTLLNSDAELSPFTVDTLNELILKGMHFSIATARSAASVVKILQPVSINIPIILMNGALQFDLKTKQYFNIHYLSKSSLTALLKILETFRLTGFMYEVRDHVLTTYYENLASKALKDFHDERVTKYGKHFVKVSDFSRVNVKYILYFTLLDTKEHLEGAYEVIKEIPGLATAYYKDIYAGEELWYLEIFSENATKYNAVKSLRDQYQYETIVGFGDNLNDLPLFQACDITCAVANAKAELKEKADYLIDSNIKDGVAHWLRRNYT